LLTAALEFQQSAMRALPLLAAEHILPTAERRLANVLFQRAQKGRRPKRA
jgi:hypothetical protein